MTPTEALDIFHQVRMKYQADGQSHDHLREAFRVLAQLVEAQNKKPENPITPNETPKA